jgi:hypothetical protein
MQFLKYFLLFLLKRDTFADGSSQMTVARNIHSLSRSISIINI